MAHGLNSVLKRGVTAVQGCKTAEGKTSIGSRRIFAPHFKLQVLDSYRNDPDCKGNQRATARKYGIHRRQIQKWLQAENTLRNSVSKVKCVENPEARKCGIEMALSNNNGVDSRQRDDFDSYSQSSVCHAGVIQVGAEPRVPALSPVYCDSSSSGGHVWPPADSTTRPGPLDFSTHSRIAACPADPSAPMDLSFKKPTPSAAGLTSTPVTFPSLTFPASPLSLPSPTSLSQPHPDVWDLSTKGTKRKCDEEGQYSPSSTHSGSTSSPKPVKLFKPYLDDIKDEIQSEPTITPPLCCSSAALLPPAENTYYYTNNNNNICEIKSEYYTLTELQPTGSINYYYTTLPYHPSEFDPHYSPFEDMHQVPLKQRQSYSLDFKLSAIDCYYQDAVCKGNQRAVASKYNIHRRQVQKWLKQAEELKQKNETMKQMHAVR